MNDEKCYRKCNEVVIAMIPDGYGGYFMVCRKHWHEHVQARVKKGIT